MILNSLVKQDPEGSAKKVFFAAILVFILLLAWCIYKYLATPIPAPILPAAETVRPLVVSEKANIKGADIISERPLFWRSRELLAVEPEEELQLVTQNSVELDKIKLLGLYSNGILVAGIKGKTRLVVGEKVGDWKLHRLGQNFAEFTRLGEYKSLSIEQPDVSFITDGQ